MSAWAARNSRKVSRRLSTATQKVADHPVVTAGARVGYAVNGLLHLLIAWLGLQVAYGGAGAKADTSGAMALAASSPVGFAVLVLIAVAFALLAVWQIGECVRGPKLGDRVKAGAKAVVYLALGWSAVSLLMGTAKSGQAQANDATATLMGLPFGPVLVILGGIAIVAVGAFHMYKGWTERFRRDLVSTPSRPILMAGKVGYIAKGIALIAVGIGVVTAGLTDRPSQSRGLDGALHDMVSLPWGQVVVTLVAAGFAAYGLYSFSRAKRART